MARRDLVPQVHVPTFADRELKERLGRRMHMVRLRTSAMNRAHSILSQFGVKLAFDRLRQPDREELLILGYKHLARLAVAVERDVAAERAAITLPTTPTTPTATRRRTSPGRL